VKTKQSPLPLRRYAGYVAAGALALLLIVAATIEWRYGVFIPTLRFAPPYDAKGVGAFVVIDPSRISALVPELAEPAAGRLPRWLTNLVLPYQAGGGAQLDMEGRRVALSGYLNARRLAPLIAREAAKVDLSQAAPEISWAGHAFEASPGLLLAEGAIPFDPDAEESFAISWSQSITPQPLEAEGGHFVEAVIDNRRGHGYLISASFLKAYNIDLSQNEHEVSIASLQFMREARFTADFAPPDTLRFRLVLDITPDAIDRVGVVNLKVGIEESVADISARWREDHGIELKGEARWEDHSIVYEYTLSSARKFLGLIRDGKLN